MTIIFILKLFFFSETVLAKKCITSAVEHNEEIMDTTHDCNRETPPENLTTQDLLDDGSCECDQSNDKDIEFSNSALSPEVIAASALLELQNKISGITHVKEKSDEI